MPNQNSHMQKTLKRIFNLVEKTGDRVIVFDSATDHSFVVMDFQDYENLVSAQSKKPLPENAIGRIADDMDLWQKTQEDLANSDFTEFNQPEAAEFEETSSEIKVQLNKGQQVEPLQSGNKYYFEDIDEQDG